jgi:hypothetical protein
MREDSGADKRMSFDPTKKSPVQFIPPGQRPNCKFLIEFNPNTGAISYGSQGFSPVEEVGVLQWMLSLRMAAHLKANEQGNISIPSPIIPPGSIRA